MSHPPIQLPLEIEDFVALSLACGARCVQFAFEPDALLGSFTSLDTVHSEWTGKARPSIQAGLLGSVARLEEISSSGSGAGPALIHVDGRLARLHFSAQAAEDGSPVLIRFTAVDGEAALGRRSDFDFVSGWMIARQEARALARSLVDDAQPTGSSRL